MGGSANHFRAMRERRQERKNTHARLSREKKNSPPQVPTSTSLSLKKIHSANCKQASQNA
ncbi:MAG: hypothetical protein ACJARZ_001513 [Dokdonia sp.]|jgi:hypothetical protein